MLGWSALWRLATVLVTVCVAASGQPQHTEQQPGLSLADAHWEALCSVDEWASRASAVEDACCAPLSAPAIGSGLSLSPSLPLPLALPLPPPLALISRRCVCLRVSGHRRSQTAHDRSIDAAIDSTGCALPSECPSQQCAEVFLPLRYECRTFVDIVAGQGNQLQAYAQLQASCEELLLQQAAPLGEPSYEQPQVFCAHERVLCDEQADCHLECAGAADEVAPDTCAHLMVDDDISWFNELVATQPVVFFGTRRDR